MMEAAKEENISSSIPGLKTVLDASQPKYKKIFWSIATAIFFSISVFQVTDRIQLYLSHPVDLEYKFQIDQYMLAPSLTICPYYGFGTMQIVREMEKKNMTMNTSSLHELLSYENMDLDKIWDMTDTFIPQLMPLCVYETSKICNNSQHWKRQKTILGICYTMDFPNGIAFLGVGNGILIRLKALELFTEKNAQYSILVHHMSDDITYAVLHSPIRLHLYFGIVIYYSHRIYRHQNSTNDPCYSQDYYNRCILQCYDNLILKNSSCGLPFTKTTKMKLCSGVDEFKNMYPIPIQKILQLEEISYCKVKCHRPCEENTYDTVIDEKHQGESFMRIGLYPRHAGTMMFTDNYSYTLVGLFCDIGATLGFYMGISILSIIETIEILVGYIKVHYK